MKIKIVIAVNSSWNLVNFRSGLIRSMVESGYEVVAIAPFDEYSERLNELGCRYVPLPMDNKGINPIKDLLLLWRFYRFLRHERPAVFLSFTVKPNIYGSLACNILRIPVINNIAGLGVVFIKNSLLTSFLRILYKISHSKSHKVFFQNNDDRQLFLESGLVSYIIADRVPGSGIDLKRFNFSKNVNRDVNRKFRFLLIARMLWDKGVGEYVEAARLLRESGTHAEFCLLGFLDVQNSTAVSHRQMDDWVSEGVIQYLGVSDSVEKEITKSDCVVLPSYYREGVPHSLLESAAIGRPIITTNSVGCREVVDDGINGYLCKPRDYIDLSDKMKKMIALSWKERQQMGLQGRKKMEYEFNEKIVIDKYLDVIDQILSD